MADMGIGEALLISSVVSTAANVGGSMMQGKARQSADNYNADLAEQQGAYEVAKLAEREESLNSTQRAMYAKAGVAMSGSPLEVMIKSRSDFEMDKAAAKYNSESKANMLRYEGKQAKTAGMFNAGNALLQGGIRAYQLGTIPTTDTGASSALSDNDLYWGA